MRMGLKARLACGAAITLLMCGTAEAQVKTFDIAAQAAGRAIPEFARQSGLQIIAPADALAGLRTPAIKGAVDARAALRDLIAGTGLEIASDDGARIVLRRARAATNASPQSSSSTDTTASTEVSDIIVTAQKRAEPQSKVPVAVTVIPASRLSANEDYGVKAIEKLTPSLTLNEGGQGATGGFRIRGIGTENYSAGVEPSVATVVDGVVIGRTAQVMSLQFDDIDRVEVLRGPQGTLFGKNSSAGVVNVVTKRPTREFEGFASGLYAENNEYRLAFGVSGPLSPTLSARLTAFTHGMDGYIKNVYNGYGTYPGEPAGQANWTTALAAQPRLLDGLSVFNKSAFGGLRSYGVRGQLLWEPTSQFSANLSVETTYSNADCCARTSSTYDPRFLPDLGGAEISPTSVQTAEDAPLTEKDRQYAATLNMSYRFDNGFELVSVSGFREAKHLSIQDPDFSSGPPLIAGGDFEKEWDYQPDDVTQFSQELRLQSPLNLPGPFGGTYDFVAGLYGFYQDDNLDGSRRIGIQIATPTSDNAYLVPCLSVQYCRRDFDWNAHVYMANAGVFGQVNYHITDRLTAILGGRFTYDYVKYKFSSDNYYNGVLDDSNRYPYRAGSFTRSDDLDHTNFSPKVGLKFQATPSLMTYASYSRGYKGPGYTVYPPSKTSNNVLNSETSDSYEIGVKGNYLSGRLTFGLSLYDTEYKNLVLSSYDPIAGYTRQFNAASVTTRGAELDMTARPIPGLNLYGGVAYMDGFFDSFPNANCYVGETAATGCRFNPAYGRNVHDVSGGRLQRAPKWKLNIGGDYTIALANLPFDAFVDGAYHFASSQLYDVSQDPASIQDAYGIGDIGFGVISKDKKSRLRVFVNNVSDKFYVDNRFNFGQAIDSRIPRDYRRYFGVNVSHQF